MLPTKVLDHGYVELIEPWGQGRAAMFQRDDILPEDRDYERGIIEAARQSTQGTFRSWDVPDEQGRTDAQLLDFLYSKKHLGPFEFAGMTIEVQAPIMVFREWHRHRTQSYNEMSARYAPLPDLVYLPSHDRVMQVNSAGRNRQAAGVKFVPLTDSAAHAGIELMKLTCSLARDAYEKLLEAGLAKELARGVLPVFQYSRMRASGNLRNWLAFMTLRSDPNAQWEIRQYAREVGLIIDRIFPRTWEIYSQLRGG